MSAPAQPTAGVASLQAAEDRVCWLHAPLPLRRSKATRLLPLLLLQPPRHLAACSLVPPPATPASECGHVSYRAGKIVNDKQSWAPTQARRMLDTAVQIITTERLGCAKGTPLPVMHARPAEGRGLAASWLTATRAQLCYHNPGCAHTNTHAHKAGHAATLTSQPSKCQEAGEVCTRPRTTPAQLHTQTTEPSSTAAHTNTGAQQYSWPPLCKVELPHTVIASLPKESHLQPDLHLALSQSQNAKHWVEPQRASSLRGRSVVQKMRWCRNLTYLPTTPSARR